MINSDQTKCSYGIYSMKKRIFSRRFRTKSRLLQWLVFFRQFNAIGPLFVHYALLPYVLTTSFSPHPKHLTWDKSHSKAEGSPFHFFWHYETSPSPPALDILQQNGCSKNPKGSPFHIFRHYATYRRLQKKFEKKFGKIFSSIFSFLRAFVVSSCRKSGFRVLSNLRYGANLGRSQLVSPYFFLNKFQPYSLHSEILFDDVPLLRKTLKTKHRQTKTTITWYGHIPLLPKIQ